MLKKDDLIVKTLGEPRYDSPLDEFTNTKEHKIKYISDDDRFLFLSSEKKLNEYVEKLKNGEDGEDIIPSLAQYIKANGVILELLDEAKIDILKIRKV